MFKNILLAGVTMSSIFSAMPAHAKDIPTIRMCTGLVGLVYHDVVGEEIKKQAKGILNVELSTSKGALDNIDKIKNNQCDVAPIQGDTLAAADNAGSIETGRALYKEYLHLICNTSYHISRVTQLNKDTKVLLGENGGGGEVTWTALVKSDPNRYGPVPHEPIGGTRAAGIVQQGRNAACMIVVSGLHAKGISDINEIAKQSDNLRLVPANDGDILRIKDARGHPVYKDDEIPSGTYTGGLQPKSLFGSSVATVSTDAVIAASTNYIDAHPGDYQLFLTAVNNAIPSIKAKLGE